MHAVVPGHHDVVEVEVDRDAGGAGFCHGVIVVHRPTGGRTPLGFCAPVAHCRRAAGRIAPTVTKKEMPLSALVTGWRAARRRITRAASITPCPAVCEEKPSSKLGR